jgi:hypothetical protein
MKRVKLDSKDRTYLLKGDSAPLTYFILSRDTKRKRLLYFDEEEGVNLTLRYARNQKSPFEHEQDANAILEPIVFEDGVLIVPKTNPVLQEFLHYHPGNGTEFYEFDSEKDAQEYVEELVSEIDALIAVRDLSNNDFGKLEAIARLVLNGNIDKMSSAEIKRDMMLFAKRYPQDFMEAASDPLLKINNMAARAFSTGYFTFRGNKDIHFNLKDNKKRLMTVPFGHDQIHALASYLQSDEGLELYKFLEDKFSENN